LFTPQRLFGDTTSSPDTLSHEPFLERARLQREQDRDGSARLALGGYVVARLVDKLLTLEKDAEMLEAFRWQLEAVRRHVEDLPGDAPEAAHLAGVVAAVPQIGPPTSSLWMSLTAYAYFLEHEGRLEESLELLTLAARSQGPETPGKDFAAYALSAGRINRQLARWATARSCYDAAEEAATRVGDSVSALRGRLGKGAVHRGQGNYPLARAVAEGVVRDATELGLSDAQAMAYADLGSIYTLQGLRLDALKAHYQAFLLSRDPLQQMRALSDLAIDLCEIGAKEAARLAFQIVVNSNAKLLVRANALLELMNLESSVGNRVAFERCRAAINETVDRLSPSMATDYQFKLGTGLARFGQVARAREAFAAGLALAEAHRLNAWVFKIEGALEQLSTPQEQQPLEYEAAEPTHPPVVGEVMLGLREYAALDGV
jgi:tetratricopeptide (TPR) repeat protein